ncbi:unnamed protein product [Effrenium voratum]|nr:unnamed protein product [Effrenium voratum]
MAASTEALLVLRALMGAAPTTPAFVGGQVHSPSQTAKASSLAPVAVKRPAASAGQPQGVSGNLVAGAVVIAALRGSQVRRRQRLQVPRRAVQERTSATVTGEVDPEDAAELAERLRLEAAQLRADVEQLEAIRAEEERRKRQQLFRSWDLDSSGTLDEKELKIGVSQECKVEIDDEKARKLLEALDDNGDGVLQHEEFCLRRVEKKLAEFQAEEREAEAEARKAAAELREKEMLERQMEEYVANLPERNEDTSLPTRLVSAAAYLLPLLDVARFGLPLAFLNPSIASFIQALSVPMMLLNTIPFGLGFLVVFIGMQTIASDTEKPALVRFNMRQAIQLDVMLFFPIILGQLGGMLTNYYEMDLPGVSLAASGAVFMVMVACIMYSMISCLMGRYPKGIPFISDSAELTLRDTRPAESEDDSKR